MRARARDTLDARAELRDYNGGRRTDVGGGGAIYRTSCGDDIRDTRGRADHTGCRFDNATGIGILGSNLL